MLSSWCSCEAGWAQQQSFRSCTCSTSCCFNWPSADHALLQVKGWRGWLHYRPEPSAGRHIYELNDSQGEPLDLDVIDNTWLDANVQVCSCSCQWGWLACARGCCRVALMGI